MRPDGSGIEQLTDFQDVRVCQPSYSPDGDWIIFSAAAPGAIDLWAIPAGGGAPVVVSDLDTTRTHGTWQPAP
jgi:Tol biopolymer transport system component